MAFTLFRSGVAEAFTLPGNGEVADNIARIYVPSGETYEADLARKAKAALLSAGWDEATLNDEMLAPITLGATVLGSYSLPLAHGEKGGSICLAIAVEDDESRLLRFLDQPPSEEQRQLAIEFVLDHEEFHCRSGNRFHVKATLEKWAEECRSDAHALVNARQRGNAGMAVITAWQWMRTFRMLSEGDVTFWTNPFVETVSATPETDLPTSIMSFVGDKDIETLESAWSGLRIALLRGNDGSTEQAIAWELAVLEFPVALRPHVPPLNLLRQVGQKAWEYAADWRRPATGAVIRVKE